jgi:urease accessory protein UreF
MMKRTQLALTDPAEWLGDWHPLAEQLGSAEGLVALGAIASRLRLRPVQDLTSLRKFLRHYSSQMLLPFELPAIHAAHGHAQRNELRELVALDQQMAGHALPASFVSASRRIGQGQLQRLRPLRDQRLVQRYLQSVETGHAHGWHTLVYGLTLAIYSLPLRQGLLGYAQQTTRSFIYSAARSLRFSERECREIFDEHCKGLPAAVDRLVCQRNGLNPGATCSGGFAKPRRLS